MVDTGDLKSPGSNTVPVRVRSPAPRQNNTIRSPAAASGVRSTDGVVFPCRRETALLGFTTDWSFVPIPTRSARSEAEA